MLIFVLQINVIDVIYQILYSNLFLSINQMMNTYQAQEQRKLTAKTSQQMFRRIDNFNDHPSRVSKTSKQSRNFPSLAKSSVKIQMKRGNSMDISNQNMMFETYLQKVGPNKIDEKSIVSNYLNFLRKDYDKMHKQIKQQSSTINLKKKDIQFIKQRIRIQKQSFQDFVQKIKKKQNQLKKIQQKQLEAHTERKTLDHIIFRMKKDQIFYKQYGTIHQGHINEKRKSLKSIKQVLLSQDEKIHKLLMTVEDMKRQFDRNQNFRSRKLQDYCQKLQNIHEKQLFIQQRKQRTLQLQSIQSNDILKAKNVEMRNICLINKVADCLFESKIQNLIKNYEHIQKAFHTIQLKTSITDPTLIASKFFSYEELTQNLLKAISGYQKKLQEKTKQNLTLKEQYKKLEEKTYNNYEVNEQKQKKNAKTSKQIQQIYQRHLTYQRILQWIQRTTKKIKLTPQELGDPCDKLLQICTKTKIEMNQLQKTIRPHEKKYTTPGIRIKKLIKQVTQDAKTQKLREAQQNLQINMTEQQYLKLSRAGVKRNFLIKQKTINMGNLASIKQSKNQYLNSDRKGRGASDNR